MEAGTSESPWHTTQFLKNRVHCGLSLSIHLVNRMTDNSQKNWGNEMLNFKKHFYKLAMHYLYWWISLYTFKVVQRPFIYFITSLSKQTVIIISIYWGVNQNSKGMGFLPKTPYLIRHPNVTDILHSHLKFFASY